MSLKSNKGRKTTGKRVDTSRPWPDLPQQLVRLIGRQSNLIQNITAFGGITKSWIATPKKYCKGVSKSEWSQLSQIGEDRHEKPKEFIITFHEEGHISWYRRQYPLHCQYKWERFVGCSHGVLVAKKVESQEYIIWAPETRYFPTTLPSWDNNIPFMFVTISCRQVDRYDNVVMVLTGIISPAFMFFRTSSMWKEGGQFKWVRQENTMVDPYGSNQSSMQFTNAIGFEGKFYALTLQGALIVIEDLNDSQLTITALSKHRAVPTVSCKHFREYLIESCGEILLVFFIFTKTYNVVDHIEVFRLHIPKLSWVKMEKLGDDRTLFAGTNCCMSVKASKVGCRKNCIYFSLHSEEGWWVYDMETSCIIPPSLSNAELEWDAQPDEE